MGKSHYVLYGLVAAMQPRMLVTFDEELRPLPVSVRVGQVCVGVGRAKVLEFYPRFMLAGDESLLSLVGVACPALLFLVLFHVTC